MPFLLSYEDIWLFAPLCYCRLLATVLNVVLILVFNVVSDNTAAIEIRLTINAYSIIVAPRLLCSLVGNLTYLVIIFFI